MKTSLNDNVPNFKTNLVENLSVCLKARQAAAVLKLSIIRHRPHYYIYSVKKSNGPPAINFSTSRTAGQIFIIYTSF